ncbi:MAG: alpha/beta fold hydrolase [Gaiellaceae bacterium]
MLKTQRGVAQVAREGHGPPVLAIHGGPGGFDQGLAYCRHLLEGGCELIAPSRPGYLRTPLESGRSPASQADLYAAILDSLEIERAAILGFSSGGPSAVQFAARHPDRTAALCLDAAILLPFEAPISALRRATYESSLAVWLSYQIARRRPELMTRLMVDGVSKGLNATQREAAKHSITSDRDRLRAIQEQWASIAPRKYRRPGQLNDDANEANLAPLPFAEITAPTLVAQGSNDAIVPVEHATHAAEMIAGAELMLVEEGHHLLSASLSYGRVARRQLELIHGRPHA